MEKSSRQILLQVSLSIFMLVLNCCQIFNTYLIYVSSIREATFIGYFQIETLMVSQFISYQLICLGLLCIRDLRHCEFSFSFALGERGLKTQFKLQLCRLIGSEWEDRCLERLLGRHCMGLQRYSVIMSTCFISEGPEFGSQNDYLASHTHLLAQFQEI